MAAILFLKILYEKNFNKDVFKITSRYLYKFFVYKFSKKKDFSDFNRSTFVRKWIFPNFHFFSENFLINLFESYIKKLKKNFFFQQLKWTNWTLLVKVT